LRLIGYLKRNDWDVTSTFRMGFNDLPLGHTEGLSHFPMQVMFCVSECSQPYAQHYPLPFRNDVSVVSLERLKQDSLAYSLIQI
jgi:hypothetical protein